MGSKRKLILLGAGAAGGEILSWLNDVPEKDRDWELGGFLDDSLSESEEGTVLGKISDHVVSPENVYLCTIGKGTVRLKICRALVQQKAQFISFIHPTVRLDPSAKVGAGCIIAPFAYIGPRAELGDFCLVNVQSSIGHHVRLAAGCTLNSHVDLTGYVIADEAATFGSHACVLQNIHIGAESVGGAGSLAVRDVRPGTTVFGLPARRLPSFVSIGHEI